jgi:AraC-like DNA-binding protein
MAELNAPFEETREVAIRLAAQRLTPDQTREAERDARRNSKQAGSRGRDLASHRYRHLFLEKAGELLNDDCFGLHLAAETDPREFGAIYYVVAASDTALDGLRNLMRYVRVVSTAEAFTVHEDQFNFAIEGRSVRGIEGFGRHMFEYGDAVLLAVLRNLTQSNLRPVSMKFDHRRSTSLAEFVQFFGCPVEFGAPIHRVVFLKSTLQAPLRSADPHLLNVVRSFFDEALRRREYTSTPLRARVEQLVSDLLPNGKATVGNVAKALSMSTRTLNRRLADEGTNYAAVLDDLRRDLALRSLKDDRLELTQIAWLLGYSEVSSFNHAFRRWTGATPKAVRSRALERETAAS